MTGVTKRPHSPEKEPKESPVKQTKLDVVKQDVEESDSDDDGDFGPLPAEEDSTDAISGKRRKRVRVLEHEALYLDHLPDQDLYERSLMHRDTVNFVAVTPTDFLITTSIDGHVKFWKKTPAGLEFVKHYRAHLGAIVAMAVSHDGTLLATAGVDKGLKIFDIVNFDMINMIKLDYLPNTVCWMHKKGQAQALLACSDRESNAIHFFDGRGTAETLFTVSTLHSHPVHLMAYHPMTHNVVSIDTSGMMEYWVPEKDEDFGLPQEPLIDWKFKSDTDLYEFKRSKTVPSTLTMSPTGQHFVTFGFGDRQIRLFNFRTGKLIKKYDESLESQSEIQQSGTSTVKLDDMEFGRRLAIDREIGKARGGQSATVNVLFDETGNFILYPTLVGIKVLNIHTNKVVRIIGKGESSRFMNISLYQGAPKKKAVVTLEMASSENPVYKESELTDPTLFCTAYKKNRFYSFSRRAPEADGNRDIFNEKPTRDDQASAMPSRKVEKEIGNNVTLHTTYGDIHIRLFPEFAPKAVENFIGLAKKGYYNNVLFHRVVKGFMIQTGDPNGDGSGGESLWGGDFQDEFHPSLRHDRPYTLSMANMGANTNASQFFITVVPTPWLDNKHTIFGRCTGGTDVVHKIEAVRTNRHDKPDVTVRVDSIEFK